MLDVPRAQKKNEVEPGPRRRGGKVTSARKRRDAKATRQREEVREARRGLRLGRARRRAKTARTEARQAAAAEKKVLTENQKISGQAAKALGPLTTAMTSMDKVWTKAEACAQVDEDTKRCCAEIRSRLQTWRKAAHDAVNLQERNAAADKENVAPLVALPFTGERLENLVEAELGSRQVCEERASEEGKACETGRAGSGASCRRGRSQETSHQDSRIRTNH